MVARLGLGLSLAGLCLTAPALATAPPNLRRFEPPADAQGALVLEPTSAPGPWAWDLGAWLSYAHRSIELTTPSGATSSPLLHQAAVDLTASLGLGERLALSLQVPGVLYQAGDASAAQRRALGVGELSPWALGDVALGGKYSLVPPGALGGFGIAALARLELPTATRDAYLGEPSVAGQLRLLGELKLVAIDLRASAGARLRAEPGVYGGEDYGHELPWAAGVTLRPQAFGWDAEGKWQWNVEAAGGLGLSPRFAAARQSAARLALSARYALGPDGSLIAGAELPLSDAVGVPLVRGVVGVAWAPRVRDADADGIPDERDECPELAEDLDGFEDHDGCPEFDDDDDGVPDDVDQCPREAEDEDGFQDDDGCPDPDNDGDGILDAVDACPNEPGPDAPGARRGCPVRDSDGDGLADPLDRCPSEPEDQDGVQDDDGCPDPDNDGDGILDADDACPNEPGLPREDPKLNGCPSPDRDGDTIVDAADRCPEAPETFNGFEDDDGCPEPSPPPRARPLVRLEERAGRRWAILSAPPRFELQDGAAQLTAGSEVWLRALATELAAHPGSVALVGVRPASAAPEAEQLALNQAFALVQALRGLAHRDDVAETVSWQAVSQAPSPKTGLGVLVLGGAAPRP